jgi:transglutaminase-like putative cysteine protease
MNYSDYTFYFDFEHPTIQQIIENYKSSQLSKSEITIELYNYVRNHWRYDSFNINFKNESYKASFIADRTSGNCVEKSIVLIACLRGLGIPARLHLSKVKNHIAVERLTKKLGTNELTPHGMINAYLNGEWLKKSPAFNKELCELYNVEPLEFDGISNSFLQQCNNDGNEFMEYIENYGHFEGVPVDFMVQNLKDNYPVIFFVNPERMEYQL